LEVQEAQNYLWDGNDWSIATNAAFVFAPSLAPVQLDYYPEGSSLFPEAYARKFFLAISGTWDKGKIPGIMTFNYDFEENRLSQPPQYFLKYRGNIFQMVVGLAFGPDGLYFSPILPNQEGKTAILKITYDPTNPHPYSVLQEEDPEALMIAKGCFGCHRLGDDRGYGGTGGPDLAYKELMPRLEARLLSEGYVNSLKELDKLDTEPLPAYKEARQEVAAADGSERIHTLVKYRLLEPKFDNLYTLMPNVGLTEKEALLITDFLLTPSQNQAEVAPAFMGITLPRRFGYWHLLFAAVAGVLLTLFALNLPRVVRSFKSRGKTGTVAG
jgi:hypothetical protein